MGLPFTLKEFLHVLEVYNLSIQPIQLFAYALGLIAVIFAVRERRYSGKIVISILAIFWAWTGVMYHIVHFSSINPAAYIFGVFFLVQAILFIISGVILPRFTFKFNLTGSSVTGLVLIVYAMIVYPALNYVSGHQYPKMPVFGVTPCPVTIFTFGTLLLVKEKVPLYILAIPFLWSLIGISAAINLQVVEDYGLFLAGILGVGWTIMDNRKKQATKEVFRTAWRINPLF